MTGRLDEPGLPTVACWALAPEPPGVLCELKTKLGYRIYSLRGLENLVDDFV